MESFPLGLLFQEFKELFKELLISWLVQDNEGRFRWTRCVLLDFWAPIEFRKFQYISILIQHTDCKALMNFPSAQQKQIILVACNHTIQWCQLTVDLSLVLRAVPLTYEAHFAGAVQIVETSIRMKMSAVFIPGTETMMGPGVRLPRSPPPTKEWYKVSLKVSCNHHDRQVKPACEVAVPLMSNWGSFQQSLSSHRFSR